MFMAMFKTSLLFVYSDILDDQMRFNALEFSTLIIVRLKSILLQDLLERFVSVKEREL